MMIKKWNDLMTSFELDDNIPQFNYIIKKHGESHRAYHNINHVMDCLKKLDDLSELMEKSDIKMAFWYHDIIYNPYGKENELKSAIAAKEFLTSQGVDQTRVSKIYDLIMATMHTQTPKDDEQAFIMDIDISILGSSKAQYEDYTKNIRSEYKFVPWFIYRKNRLRIMQSFLQREQLYFSDYYRRIYEEKARENISREISNLKSK